jgi:hypothetical protein
MPDEPFGHLILLLFSVLAGLAGGLLGIGGGLILVPLLTIGFDFSTQQAVSISLLAVVANSIAVAGLTARDGLPNIRQAMFLEPLALVFGAVGGWAGTQIGGFTLRRIFACFTMLMAILFLRPSAQNEQRGVKGDGLKGNESKDSLSGSAWVYFDRRLGEDVWYQARSPTIMMVVTAIAAFLAGLLGIGGGALIVPAFHFVGGIPLLSATATSSYLMAVSATGGAVHYFQEGLIPLVSAAEVNIGVVVGAFFSRWLAPKIATGLLKKIFASVLLLVSLRMWIR